MLKFKPHMSKFFGSSTEQNNAEKALGNLFALFPNAEIKMVTKEHVFFVSIQDMSESSESRSAGIEESQAPTTD